MATSIANIFTGELHEDIVIAQNSLNPQLYDEDKGYTCNAARVLDENIYGYVDDSLFCLSYEHFIENVKKLLD